MEAEILLLTPTLHPSHSMYLVVKWLSSSSSSSSSSCLKCLLTPLDTQHLSSLFLASWNPIHPLKLSTNMTSVSPFFTLYIPLWPYMGLPGGSLAKNLPANAGDARDMGLIPGSGRSLGVGNGYPLLYSCLEKFCGQRSLAGYSPCGCKASDMTEWLSTAQHNNIMRGVTMCSATQCICVSCISKHILYH